MKFMIKNLLSIFQRKVDVPVETIHWPDLQSKLSPYTRIAWVPDTVERRAGPLASKFSGTPGLAIGETWPCCGHCQQPMQLFVQLNVHDLPEEALNAFGGGLLQVFYCTNQEQECEIECEAYAPFAKSTLIRVLDPAAIASESSDSSPVSDAFPERKITGWIPKEDYPNWEELHERGMHLSDAEQELLSEQGYPLPKDKLLGWPHWVQGVEYPSCPDCGKAMRLVCQIDSEDNLPIMFGDAGCAHVTQCEDHRDRLAIAWACY
ncbi:DUF1963 domain-containing protein [Burkholderiaceae bacterium DAT-1]|nr:DUF1963 domain-containing protein [Burkholderiaceae bacterium DAT-1]